MSDVGSDWYGNPEALLTQVRAAGRSAGQAILIDGYDDLTEIRRGGQGVVFAGRQRSTKRRVAIKVLSDASLATRAARLRFEREVDLVAGLEHPGIVTVYDSGHTRDGRHYLAMRFVDGLPLDEWVRRRVASNGGRDRPFIRDALRLFQQVCDAVNHAHQHGVVHRDLKPGNILVDADGRPNIVDFGLARMLLQSTAGTRDRVTIDETFMGTLAYASPEQAAGSGRTDIRTDVYGLGVILYEMLTGHLPRDTSGSIGAALRAITATEPIPPGRWSRSSTGSSGRAPAASKIDMDLETIILKAIASMPDRRYQSADLLRLDIERYLSGRPVEARRDSTWYVAGKALRRHWLAATAAGAFLLLLAASGVGMTLLYQKAREEADKAQKINYFLQDTLASVKPARQDEPVTLDEVLEEAVHWVDLALSDEPAVASAVRNTLGNSLRAIGRLDAAEAQLVSGLNARRRMHGAVHGNVAESLNSLGWLRHAQGRLDEAERLFREALAMRIALLGDDSLDVAMSHSNVARVCLDRGALDEAEIACRACLSIRTAALGPRHPDVAMAQYRLAVALEASEALEEAESLHRAALDTRQGTAAPTHPDTAQSLVALGGLLMRTNRPELAEPMFRKCVEARRVYPGADHWQTAEAEGQWGACLAALGRFDEAETELLSSHAVLAKRRGPAHAATAESVEQIIHLYDAWGRPAEALQWRARRDAGS